MEVEGQESLDRLSGAVKVFSDLESWACSESAMGLSVGQMESEIVARSREAMRLLLQEWIDRKAQEPVLSPGQAVSVPDEEGNVVLLTHRLRRPRQQRTTVGGVEVKRTGYGYPGGTSVYPLDERVQLPEGIYSYPLQEHLVRAAVRGPFAEALRTVEEYTGEKVPKRSLETILERAAEDMEGFYAERAVAPPQETSSIVVATADCKGVPMIAADRPKNASASESDGESGKTGVKRMAVVTATYTVAPRPRTPEEVWESLFRDPNRPRAAPAMAAPDARPEGKRVWASLTEGKDAVLKEMAAEVERRDPERTKMRVALTDGERALQTRVLRHLPGVLLILDLMHALDKLWKAAQILFPKGPEQRHAWVRRQSLQVLKGKVSEVVRGMRQSVTKRSLTGKARKELLQAASYLYKNRKHMAYHGYLAQGLPIASGAVEGACKNLVRDRMERSGMRWSLRQAEAMLRLRAVYLSDDFDEYWAFHITREQARLHPEGSWAAANIVD
jgi:hypothetical protein